MTGTIQLGKIAGIPVQLHFSWFFILVLLTVSLAVGFFPTRFPGLDTTTVWIISLLSAILLFVAVLIHELSHSFVAQGRGMRVHSIVLFVFGGVSNIEGDPPSARDEFLIAVVGPLTSFALAVVFFGLSLLTLPLAALAVFNYLALVNALLGAFNLIPGFPLDGGRVLRSLIWGATNSLRKATQWAAAVGQGIGWLFIFAGFYIAFFLDALLSGIWLALIGFFLASAAEAQRQQAAVGQRFQGIRVRELMNPSPATVTPDTRLDELVERYVLARNIRALPVVEGDWLAGIVTVVDIRDVPRERWLQVPAREVMTPADRLKSVRPEDSLQDAIGLLGQGDFHQLPVMQDGRLAGLLSRSEVIRFLQVREELGLEEAETASRLRPPG